MSSILHLRSVFGVAKELLQDGCSFTPGVYTLTSSVFFYGGLQRSIGQVERIAQNLTGQRK
jgi:hypothetical protein